MHVCVCVYECVLTPQAFIRQLHVSQSFNTDTLDLLNTSIHTHTHTEMMHVSKVLKVDLFEQCLKNIADLYTSRVIPRTHIYSIASSWP